MLGEVPTREGTVTAEPVAINSVMAGCKVEDFPVVVAADSMKHVSGVPGYDYVVVDYPHAVTATWEEDEIKALAKEVAPQARELLAKQLGA